MTTATPAVIQMLINSIQVPSVDAAGKVTSMMDTEMLLYRLFDVGDAENFPAYVEEAKNCISMGMAAERHLTPSAARYFREDMTRIVRDFTVSVTGKSSEEGRLLRELLRDSSEMFVSVAGKDKSGILDKLRGVQGDAEAQGQVDRRQVR